MAKRPSDRSLIKLAEECGGIIKTMAERKKVARQTMYNWINSSEEIKQAIKDSRSLLIDEAEQCLRTAITEKQDVRAAIYITSTLGRSRGYVQLVETKDRSKLEEQLDSMTDDEILEELEKSRQRIANG